jgi:hypothetical protein
MERVLNVELDTSPWRPPQESARITAHYIGMCSSFRCRADTAVPRRRPQLAPDEELCALGMRTSIMKR